MPVTNATFKGNANPAHVVNPGSYISGVVKTVRDTFSQITVGLKNIKMTGSSAADISQLDDKILNDIGLGGSNQTTDISADLINHQQQRMYWY